MEGMGRFWQRVAGGLPVVFFLLRHAVVLFFAEQQQSLLAMLEKDG